MDTALLLIDAQVNMFEPEPVHRAANILATLEDLLTRARAANAPVIFVLHIGGADEVVDPHNAGRAIHPRLKPGASDVIINKHTPDAFYLTGLDSVLAERGIRRLVVAGMLTDYCIDTTCRRAFSLDYEVVLAADGHSTSPGDHPGALSPDQIIAHHNAVLSAFADVRAAAEIEFTLTTPPAIELEGLTAADRRAILSGLKEWQTYETWLATGEGKPFWPHSHPARLADELKALWDPTFSPRGRYLDPPRWEVGLARTFLRPLMNIPPAFRKTNLQAVKGAIDHLLQNPRNPLSNQIRQLNDQVWLYDSRDLRLFYSPHVTHDKDGRERHYIFLVWLAPGVPVYNPFA